MFIESGDLAEPTRFREIPALYTEEEEKPSPE